MVRRVPWGGLGGEKLALALAQVTARQLVQKYAHAIRAVADALMAFGTLDGAAIDRLCGLAPHCAQARLPGFPAHR